MRGCLAALCLTLVGIARYCWVKTDMEGNVTSTKAGDLGSMRESGYYDPCQDAQNIEHGVDYQGADLVHGGYTGVDTPEACCRKCIATPGCKYYTLGINPPNAKKDDPKKGVCWVKSSTSGNEKQPNRASGTFMIKADGSIAKAA
jgi:hypothetical protein